MPKEVLSKNVLAKDVLIVVDLQNDFCPGGALAVPDGDQVVAAVNALGQRFDHVVMTQDWHPAGHSSFASSHPGKNPFEVIEVAYGAQVLWPDHCVQASEGAAFHAGLDLPHAEMVVRKGFDKAIDSYSAFFENDQTTPTGLGGYLTERGFSRVQLCGLATDFCVNFTALDARKLGFEVVLHQGACRAIDLDGSLDKAMGAMTEAGVVFEAGAV